MCCGNEVRAFLGPEGERWGPIELYAHDLPTGRERIVYRERS